MRTKVLIVDDSALMRQMLSEIIGGYDDFEVVGVAHDPYIAREKIKALNPDVLTLDVEMPRMDGLTFLENLMRLRPMPVLMVSSLTKKNAETTLRALELGAVDFVTKPVAQTPDDLARYGEMIVEKLRATACAGLPRARSGRDRSRKPSSPAQSTFRPGQLVAIGASTGGTEALRDVLTQLPDTFPPVLVVQHMPEMFTTMFAKRLDGLCKITVTEAQNGERIVNGHAYIAPGDMHMRLARQSDHLVVSLDRDPPVNRHRPAVDVLFHSIAEVAGKSTVGVILTGMGADGKSGIRALKEAGARTLAQDRDSCVVFGMPKAAIDTGCVDAIVPIEEMADEILRSVTVWKQ
jgi:two-component system chemotaxis response regulator CheB